MEAIITEEAVIVSHVHAKCMQMWRLSANKRTVCRDGFRREYQLRLA